MCNLKTDTTDPQAAGSRILVIDLWPVVCDCTICGAETSDKFGIAVYEDVIVPDNYEGEWGGAPVCARCFYITRGMQEQNPGKALTFAQVKKVAI